MVAKEVVSGLSLLRHTAFQRNMRIGMVANFFQALGVELIVA